MLFHVHLLVILFLVISISSSLLCLFLSQPFTKVSIQETNFPIHSTFQLPSPLPAWPPGNGFASGHIDLGGLQVHQVTKFKKIWETYQGGPDNLGATFYEPNEIPNGYFMLGSYAQPNSLPLFGSILVAKDKTDNKTSKKEALMKPIDYTLIWSSQFSRTKQDLGHGYIWFPIPPKGYEALGHVVTTSPEKPSLDKIRCVRKDLTEDCDIENWIWGEGKNKNDYGFQVYSLCPFDKGTQSQGLLVGAFGLIFVKDSRHYTQLPLSCLKNKEMNFFSSMPNLLQIKALIKEYSPKIFLHPKEIYLPSSINWFFANGAKLYQKGQNSKPTSIHYDGSNLPQGGLDDETYWIDLPLDKKEREKLKKGNLPSFESYIHVKPIFGGTFSDIIFWVFYPFNGPAIAKLGPFNIPLGGFGEHVGDWEHITLRISNFNGILDKVFWSQHSGGTWIDASLLEFYNFNGSSSNKLVGYAALHGHAIFPRQGMVPKGFDYIGIINDMKKSELVLDCGERYVIIGADYDDEININLKTPPPPIWVNYAREWGPKVTYNIGILVKKLMMDNHVLVGVYKKIFLHLLNLFPNEIWGEEGPTGPKMKGSWNKDELI
ncbi:hypothetical protein M9H77_25275 [Catharanthus roseus]|uniref:Uncharacterized protein n=1 Tax=Catharanthus roseus TaxID=4058 RepID=A0ACC0A7Q4_CATRO|nr:hypothetical protein M9H77_25275 [Catharanthus roseus]